MLRDLEKLGVACAVLAANRSWTTFAQLDTRIIDGGAFARVLDVAIVQVWSDEDHGTTVAFFDVDGWRAELPVELGCDGTVSSEDRQLLAELVRRDFVTKDRADALARQIATKAKTRDVWLARGGVEEGLELPDATRLPLPCSPEVLRQMVPLAQLTPRRMAHGTAERPRAPRRTGSPAVRALEELHRAPPPEVTRAPETKAPLRTKAPPRR
jgi:hypothetical protein